MPIDLLIAKKNQKKCSDTAMTIEIRIRSIIKAQTVVTKALLLILFLLTDIGFHVQNLVLCFN